MTKQYNYAKEIFYVAEGHDSEGKHYEYSEIDQETSDEVLRALFEQFIKNRKNGPARLMVSNQKDENWE